MPKQREDITLYGEPAEAFRDARSRLEDRWGFEPTKSQVVAYILGESDL
ncbi:hypothetical protein [Salarchaeum japonicum]|nr:hypothetical protein [Salarchaeum japonicum]